MCVCVCVPLAPLKLSLRDVELQNYPVLKCLETRRWRLEEAADDDSASREGGREGEREVNMAVVDEGNEADAMKNVNQRLILLEKNNKRFGLV